MDTNQLEVEKMEYLRLCNDISSIESKYEKIFTIGITIVSIMFIYGMKERVYEVFFIVPLSLILLIIYHAAMVISIIVMASYKEHLEKRINLKIKDDILVWESALVKKLIVGSAPYIIIQTVLIILGLVISALSFIQIYKHFPLFVFIVSLSIFFIIALIALLVVANPYRYFKKAHEAIQKYTTKSEKGQTVKQ